MATITEHRTEIDRINGEVAAQSTKIAQLNQILTGNDNTASGDIETTSTPIEQNTADLDALIANAITFTDNIQNNSNDIAALKLQMEAVINILKELPTGYIKLNYLPESET